jgi:hypothetical protein
MTSDGATHHRNGRQTSFTTTLASKGAASKKAALAAPLFEIRF